MWFSTFVTPTFAYIKSFIGPVGHTEKGTEYGLQAVKAYTESNHGPDGKLFLDPYFKPDLETVKNKKILDAGCGAAPWAIYAARNGGNVFAIDIQKGMIESAKKAIASAKVEKKVKLFQGDVAALPYENSFFDKIISICVGCNLPPESFDKHFHECNRTLKDDGILILGAPHSLNTVFTDGSCTREKTLSHIKNVLLSLEENPSSEQISDKLNLLSEVLSATFVVRNDKLILADNSVQLSEGENIWRKLPKLVVPNRHYSSEYYAEKFKEHGFAINSIEPHFESEEDRIAYNACADTELKLGPEYVSSAPFVIFRATKMD